MQSKQLFGKKKGKGIASFLESKNRMFEEATVLNGTELQG